MNLKLSGENFDKEKKKTNMTITEVGVPHETLGCV